MQVIQNKESTKFFASCSSCGHIRVCSLFRAIAPLLEKWTDETKPFEAESLASICKEYLSDQIIQTLKGGDY